MNSYEVLWMAAAAMVAVRSADGESVGRCERQQDLWQLQLAQLRCAERDLQNGAGIPVIDPAVHGRLMGAAMKPFQRLSYGDERTVTLQVKQSDAVELLDLLKYVGEHFTALADDHLKNGEHDVRTECIELAAISARHWLEINHQLIFKKPSGFELPPRS
jgi:hypothetical protein